MAFKITGSPVQHVGLRHFIQDAAVGYNLTGFVRYEDRNVVGEAQGLAGENGLFNFHLGLWKGSPASAIEWVKRHRVDELANEDSFDILDDSAGGLYYNDDDDSDDDNDNESESEDEDTPVNKAKVEKSKKKAQEKAKARKHHRRVRVSLTILE